MSADLNKILDEVKSDFVQFKETNDQLIEGKAGKAELEAKLAKINEAMDANEAILSKAQDRMDALETSQKRSSVDVESKGDTPEMAEYKAAGAEYFKSGSDSAREKMVSLEKKALVSNNDPQGGFLTFIDQSGPIAQRIFETSPVRQVARVITTNAQAVTGPIRDNRSTAGWVGETDSRPATDTADIGLYKIVPHEIYANPEVSQTLLEDSMINVEQMVMEDTMQEFGLLENTAFVTGDGIDKPKGFMAYAETPVATYARNAIGTRTSGSSGTFDADDLLNLSYDLLSQYRANAAYGMSRSSIGLTRTLKSTDGVYLWQPSLIVGAPATFNGIPVIEFNDVADVASGAKSVIIADWQRFYMVVDRVGVSTLRDPYSSKPFVQFYSRKRVGGGAISFDSAKILKCGA